MTPDRLSRLDPGGLVPLYHRIKEDLTLQRPMRAPRHAERDPPHPRTADDDEVYALERIRYVQGTPVSLQTSHIPARLPPGLETRDVSGAHLFGVLQREYGAVFLRAEEFVEPALADEYVAEQLQVAVGSPLFLGERHCYTFDDRVGEFRRAHVRGDLCRYRIDLR